MIYEFASRPRETMASAGRHEPEATLSAAAAPTLERRHDYKVENLEEAERQEN